MARLTEAGVRYQNGRVGRADMLAALAAAAGPPALVAAVQPMLRMQEVRPPR